MGRKKSKEEAMEVRILGEAGAGDKAAVVVKSKAKVMPETGASSKEAKAAGVPRIVIKDGKRMQLVSEEFMSWLRSKPSRPPLPRYSIEFLRGLGLDDDADLAVVLDGLQAAQDIREIEKDILEQYNTTGHAYVELLDGAKVDDEV